VDLDAVVDCGLVFVGVWRGEEGGLFMAAVACLSTFPGTLQQKIRPVPPFILKGSGITAKGRYVYLQLAQNPSMALKGESRFLWTMCYFADHTISEGWTVSYPVLNGVLSVLSVVLSVSPSLTRLLLSPPSFACAFICHVWCVTSVCSWSSPLPFFHRHCSHLTLDQVQQG
jgi:hypothetical protein